jgi:RNA polymerase sigma factor (sigma-70 family)
MATGFQKVLEHLQQAGGLTDGQLLTRFVAQGDEASYAALVRRHGPMVLGVCRRVLHNFHDAEDAFQATFLVLARKAASVVKRESVGCWLYGVAYRTALEAHALQSRRRSRERPMKDMPHPEVAPAEAQNWRPLLDRELSGLPEKYRAAILLCDLEGRTRKEAARQLGVPEGTLSSRLATARQLLARRLAGCGLTLSAAALAAALSQGAAPAQVPAALVHSTARAAALVAAGQLAAASAPAVVLMQRVMKAMLLKKLRMVVGAVVVMAALGAVGFGVHAGDGTGAAPPDKPSNELEALRKENELLKLNLQVVLEKVRAQEGELQTIRKEVAARNEGINALQPYVEFTNRINPNLNWLQFQGGYPLVNYGWGVTNPNCQLGWERQLWLNNAVTTVPPPAQDPVADAATEAENAIKALREAKDKEGQRQATEALDKAMKKLRKQFK